ncbi:PDDEXK nuclease domain-containing protein [Variovorax sp. PBS-H4]|uniref:PDDEXK nuclease domain-containing protein n=1 Tax=Variovorax sp. PBS-H4 TaxID=434008 RepID=UPI001E60CFD8|nr:PDDEXK nuclease domain-containing protein [Variovorax sp. PBS-H4]
MAAIGVEVRSTRLRAARAANTELVALYWRIGRLILERQRTQPWGSKVIRQLAADLRREFPSMTGLSATNLQYMRAFAAAWPAEPVSPQPVGKLPWGHVRALLDQLDDPVLRDWYAQRDAVNNWSRQVLEHHIATGLHRRAGAAPNNFTRHLEPSDADQAQEIVKDPYIFDFLDLDERSKERAIEEALTDRLQDTLAELGPGFAFVGRQVHLAVDSDEFFIDLLLFHAEQVRYVVVELKVGKFRPEFAGQLAFYVTLVDEQLRHPDRHAPTVGILLCSTGSNDSVVRYALRSTNAPMAIATYTYDMLPPAEQAALPAAEAITAAFTGVGELADDTQIDVGSAAAIIDDTQ